MHEFLSNLFDGVKQFLVNLLTTGLNLLFALGLPCAAWFAGEVVSSYRYPQGDPLSGVGVLGALATIALWYAWVNRSLKIDAVVALIRLVLCYGAVFLPTFWLIPKTNAFGAAVYAALAYLVAGHCALNVWKRRPAHPSPVVIRGPGAGDPAPGDRKSSGAARPAPSVRPLRPGELTPEEIKALARSEQTK